MDLVAPAAGFPPAPRPATGPSAPVRKAELTVAIRSSAELLRSWGRVEQQLFDQRHLAGTTLQQLSGYSRRDQEVLQRAVSQASDPARAARLLGRLQRQAAQMASLGADLLAGPNEHRPPDTDPVSQQVYRLRDRSTIDTAQLLADLQWIRHPER